MKKALILLDEQVSKHKLNARPVANVHDEFQYEVVESQAEDFGNLAVDEEKGCLNFNFMLISTPDNTLTEENEDLQDFVGGVLESVLENAIVEGSLLENERTTNTE